MTPAEIKNESMRVPKGKEIEEVNQKVEEDMQPVRSAGG
jgi:hypothetical protein